MKKIAILTFHASHNYGSVLQAYALSKQLKLLGYEAEIINLRNEAQKEAYKIIKNNMKMHHKIFSLLVYKKLKKRFDHYERFIKFVLPISTKEYKSGDQLRSETLDYDIYICGSDQIWNPHCQDFETAYYLDFVDKKQKKISYAPSLGRTEFTNDQLDIIKRLIEDFHRISVREKQGAEILRKLTDKEISIVCDPVLLLEKKYWDEFCVLPKINKPYILTYFLENNHGDKQLLDKIKTKTRYKVIALNEYLRDYFKPYYHAFDSSPEQFVGLFKYASFIYTNSFHGTVFATIFNKPFLTAIAKNQKSTINNNDCRKIDYLELVGLKSRVSDSVNFSNDSLLNIDYKKANTKMNEFREYSLSFLKNAIESF